MNAAHVLCGLAVNPALPAELVDRLITLADRDLADDLADRTDLSREQVHALAARGEEAAVKLARSGLLRACDVDPRKQPRAALALLDEGAGRAEWARLFASHPDVAYREELAACPGLPADVAGTLAADPDLRVVTELALWTTADLTGRLARHPHAEVRCAVAANEATPPAVLASLITGEGLDPARRCLLCDGAEQPSGHGPRRPRPVQDLHPGASCDGSHQSVLYETQRRAVRNPATPAHAVMGFAGHPAAPLRAGLAARSDLSPRAARRLAGDPAPGVRAALAGNPALGDTLMRVLAADRDADVRRALAHHPRVPLDVLVRLAGTVRTGPAPLPRVATASPAEVVELAASPDAEVRMLPAARRDLPAAIRDALAADPDAKVVTSVASHPGLSEARLRRMVDRYGIQVVAGVAANPDASPGLLDDLARRRPPVRKALKEIAGHRHATAAALSACLADARARPLAARHPALPARLLVDLLGDDEWRVAEAAAANPSLPPAVMERLVARRGIS
ncbi:hypothetical protein [Streptomyces glaucescens]|uniref:Leucine rich repeat variant n=1 Tax=Streptomyces glaucescens TaxID=1907 RepID=A0A089XFK0_STRGA|nr:hypothetical protein [Streptomyces glaucescens]AIS02074.1 hypothetical protein SGLAU_30700 [Streptomyces glaucescens]